MVKKKRFSKLIQRGLIKRYSGKTTIGGGRVDAAAVVSAIDYTYR